MGKYFMIFAMMCYTQHVRYGNIVMGDYGMRN